MVYLRDWLQAEFHWHSFGFQHTRSRDFVSSQWDWFKPTAYIVYRLLVMVVILVWLIIDSSNATPTSTHDPKVMSSQRGYFWETFATNWSLQALFICFLLYAIATVYYNRDETYGAEVKFYQVLWFFHTISINSVMVICIIFWVFMSRQKPEALTGVTSEIRWKHSLPAIIALGDTIVSCHPFRLLQFIYPVIFGLIYVAFTAAFYYAKLVGPYGVGVIYKEFDWSQPERTGMHILQAIICSILVQICLVFVYLVRGYVSNLIGGKSIPHEMYQQYHRESNDRHPILKNNRSGLFNSGTSYE